MDYFDRENTLFCVDEPNRVVENAAAVEEEFRQSMANRLEKGYVLPGQTDLLKSCQSVVGMLNLCKCITISSIEPRKGEWDVREKYQITAKSVNSYNNSFELLVRDLAGWKRGGYRVILLCGSRTRAQRLAQDLQNEGLGSFTGKI